MVLFVVVGEDLIVLVFFICFVEYGLVLGLFLCFDLMGNLGVDCLELGVMVVDLLFDELWCESGGEYWLDI